MKLVILTYFIYLFINCSVSLNAEISTKKYFVKPYPKKVYQLNDGKYEFIYNKPRAKKGAADKSYTVFSRAFPNENAAEYLQVVPDSPYFPVETPSLGQLKRVKKVLTEQIDQGFRRKRFAVEENAEEKMTAKTRVEKIKAKTGVEKKNPKTRKTDRRKKSKFGKTLRVKPVHKKKNKLGLADNYKNNRKALKRHRGYKNSKLPMKKYNTRNKHLRKSDDKLKKSNTTHDIHSTKEPLAMTRSRTNRKVNARRLIAGRDALIEDYPHVVSIQKGGQHWCAGALLNPRLIITTANCMWRSKQVSRMRVRAGSRYTDRGGQVARIQEVAKHPAWRIRGSPDNDVALALLDRNIGFSHSVHGVDLPNRVMLPAFDDAWITSWGSERRDGIYDDRSMTLQVYHARLIDRVKCNNVTQRFGATVTENFFCLAQSGRRAPCTRDTGAPAVSDGVLWGLASWGIRKLCGTERFPAVFSYVASHTNMDFITNATHYLMADQRYYPFPDRFPLQRATSTDPPVSTLPF